MVKEPTQPGAGLYRFARNRFSASASKSCKRDSASRHFEVRFLVLCKRQVVKCKQQLQERDSASRHNSKTSDWPHARPGSGSFCCRLLLFSPYCRTPSGGGGRSAVSRFLPEPLSPNPGRSVGPGFLARAGAKPLCRFRLLCALQFQMFFRCFWLIAGSKEDIVLRGQTLLGGSGSRMASREVAGKGSEELVGQALARSFWAQGLAEEEAGHQKPWRLVKIFLV